MFNQKSSENEIYAEMEKQLYKNAFIEDSEDSRTKLEAIKLLTFAADKFEQSGMVKESELVTRIAEFVSNK